MHAVQEQGSVAWHEERRRGIGGSDAAVVMGVSPYKSPYMLWAEKTGRVEPQPPNPAMLRGVRLEDEARTAYEKTVGGMGFPAVLTHPEHAWMRASLDWFSADATYLAEFKCPGQADHATALKGEVPAHYWPQIQHYCAVAMVQTAHYWSFDGRAGVLVVVRPDPAYIARLIAAERAFWHLVETNTPPEMTDRDVIERHDARWAELARAFLEAESIVAEWTEKQKAAREALIAEAGSLARVRGAGVLATRFVTKGNVQYAKVPQLKGVDLEPYRAASRETWRVAPEKIEGVDDGTERR